MNELLKAVDPLVILGVTIFIAVVAVLALFSWLDKDEPLEEIEVIEINDEDEDYNEMTG